MPGLPSNFVFKQSLETTALKPHIVSIISPKPHFHISIKLHFCYKNKARAITRPTKICTVTTLTNFFFFSILIGTIYFTILWWFLPYIDMHQPQVYMSPILTLPPTSLPIPSLRSSQCTGPEHPVSCIEPGLAIRFTYDNRHVQKAFFNRQMT